MLKRKRIYEYICLPRTVRCFVLKTYGATPVPPYYADRPMARREVSDTNNLMLYKTIKYTKNKKASPLLRCLYYIHNNVFTSSMPGVQPQYIDPSQRINRHLLPSLRHRYSLRPTASKRILLQRQLLHRSPDQLH